MKKLFTILLVVFIVIYSNAQDTISIMCLVSSDPPPPEFVQPSIDLFRELGFRVTVEVLGVDSPTSGYDVVVIGENIGSDNIFQKAYSTAPMPVLLWKLHNVKSSALDWGERGDNTADSVIIIIEDHDIFTGLPEDEIQYCAPMGEEALGWVDIGPAGGYTVLGEHPGTTADMQWQALAVALEGADLNGNMLENRVAIFATKGESFATFTEDGKLLLSNIVYWLAGREIVGVESHSSSARASVYPNPSSGMVKMKLDQAVSNLAVTVSGIDGRQLFTRQYQNTSFEELDLSGLETGYYIIQLEGSDFTHMVNLLITR